MVRVQFECVLLATGLGGGVVRARTWTKASGLRLVHCAVCEADALGTVAMCMYLVHAWLRVAGALAELFWVTWSSLDARGGMVYFLHRALHGLLL